MMSTQTISDAEATSADEFGFVQEDIDSVSSETKEEKRVVSTLDKRASKCIINTHLKALGDRLTAPASFVELLQWWKDRIIESYGLKLADFAVIRDHRDAEEATVIETVYKVQDSSQKDLGYIHFISSKGDTAGVLTIVNRDLILQPSMILSQDTMSQDDRFSQSPGVGLGRALLSFVGHSVSCKTGGYNMNLSFNTRNELVANATIMSQKSINEFRRSVAPRASKLVPFIPSPKADTIFTIGGGKSPSRKVTQRELEVWCQTSLFLQNIKEDDIVKTDMGDLILNQDFRGKLYLKGFLLSETNKRGFASLSEKPLGYGYNILYGTPDAKGEHMSSLEQECQGIMSIWDLVLKQQPQLVGLLSELLNDWWFGDVALADQFIKPDTVGCLRDYLFRDTSKWYYPTKARQNPELKSLISGLDRQGGELRDEYWSILKKHGMVHTVEVEQHRCFLTASRFARNIERTLQACLCTCRTTFNFDVMFVRGGEVPFEVVIVKDEEDVVVVRIHEKWTCQGEVKHQLELWEGVSLPELTVRTTKALFKEILGQLRAQLSDDEPSENWKQMLYKYKEEDTHSELLNLQFEPSSGGDSVTVSWGNSIPPEQDASYYAQIHQTTTCLGLQHTLFTKDILLRNLCCINTTCRISKVALTNESRRYRFQDCQLGQTYFGIVYDPGQPFSIPIITDTFTVPADMGDVPFVGLT